MKYTIIKVGDRSKDLININKKKLKDLEFVDSIDFFDGRVLDPHKVFISEGIRTDTWAPYEGREGKPLNTEYGVWISVIRCLQFIVKNNIDKMLVLEDDVAIYPNFKENLENTLKDLPKDFDFLSLFHNKNSLFNEETDIGSKYIHLPIYQGAPLFAMIYSYSGAKKILSLLKDKGIESTADDFIYQQSRINLLKGYVVRPENNQFVFNANLESIIDPIGTVEERK